MKNNVIQKKNGIVVVGAIFVDIKGFPQDIYVPDGRNAGYMLIAKLFEYESE